MALPPLAPIPHLRRLLLPEETLLYTVKFHPLLGWPYLVVALVALGVSYVFPLALLVCIGAAVLWFVPLQSNEVAVTDGRLLLRIGRLQLQMEAFDDASLLRWRLDQNALDVLLHTGRITLRIRDQASVREIVLKWVWHPLTLLEALQAMQDEQLQESRASEKPLAGRT